MPRVQSFLVAGLLLLLASGGRALAASPRTGDWEAGGRLPASFSVSKAKPGWKLADLALVVPQRCPHAGTRPVTFTLPQEVVPVKQNGRVNWSTREAILSPAGRIVIVGRTTVRGSFRTPKRANLTFSHTRYPPPGARAGTRECQIPATRFTAHPAKRLPVRDGGWKGTAATGEPVFFDVVAHGRAISFAVPVSNSPFLEMFVSFAFGQGCKSAPVGATCSSTDPAKADFGAVDPCLHGTSTNALISPGRSSSVADLQDFDVPDQFYGPVLASATIHFTGPRTARGTYTQPGDPACSSIFTAATP